MKLTCAVAASFFPLTCIYSYKLAFRFASDRHNGIVTREDIDIIAEHPEMDAIQIYGLKQDTFDYFISRYGKQFKRIHFFKDNLVEDWSRLAELVDLECVYWYWNQRISTLWDMSGNRKLKALHIADFTRLHDLAGIEKAKSLQMLYVGNLIWPKMKISSLMPVAGMALEYLVWEGKTIEDQDLSFFLMLKHLKKFDCPLNFFTTEQCAWIAANCPHVHCRVSEPYEIWDNHNGTKEALVTGKGKPALLICPKNEERIRKYEQKFEKLKAGFAGVPYRQAFPATEEG